MAIKTLFVEKESYISKKTGKENFSYFVKGIIKGKEVKAILAPPDIGGLATKRNLKLILLKLRMMQQVK